MHLAIPTLPTICASKLFARLPPSEFYVSIFECPALRFARLPSYSRHPREGPMPFSIRRFRRFPVQCAVSYNAGPFQGQGTVRNLSFTGWRPSGDLPMRPGETLSLTVTLPNEQYISIPEAVGWTVLCRQSRNAGGEQRSHPKLYGTRGTSECGPNPHDHRRIGRV